MSACSALEQQVSEWQQRIKAMEGVRNAEVDEEAKTLAHQRQQIELLRKENARLQEELGQGPQAMGSAQQERVEKLQDLIETYNRKIEVESRQVEAMNQELEVTQAKVLDLRRLTGGPQSAVEASRQALKTRQLLENRLEQMERRFCETLAKNNELRAEIESHNKDREAFEQLCQRLERDIASRQAELDAVRAAIAIADEARVSARRSATALQVANQREAGAAEEVLKSLADCQGADKQLLLAQAQRLEAMTAAGNADSSPTASQLPSAAQCEQLISQLLGITGIGDQHLRQPKTSNSKNRTSSEPLQQLVAYCCRLEAQNFEVFSSCNQANEKLGALQQELEQLQAEAAAAEAQGALAQQKEVIQATLAKRDAACKRMEGLRDKQVGIERRLALVRAGVAAALKALGVVPAQPAKPQDPACVFATLMENLGLFETRARAVVAVYSTILGKSGAAANGLVRSNSAASRGNAPVSLPSTGLTAPKLSKAKSSSARDGFGGPVQQSSRVSVISEGVGNASSTATFTVPGPDGGGNSSSDSDSDAEVPLTRMQLEAKLGYR
ncbi:hypothetical protein V8C86DRAFT_2497064 [Haematococcus lacustris]